MRAPSLPRPRAPRPSRGLLRELVAIAVLGSAIVAGYLIFDLAQHGYFDRFMAPSAAPVGTPYVIVNAPSPASSDPIPTIAPVNTAPASPAGSPVASGLPTLLIYNDYQCTFCRDFAAMVLPALRRDWVDTGRLHVEWIDVAISGDESLVSGNAARCGAEQGHYWDMQPALFGLLLGWQAGSFTRERLLSLAPALGLDRERYAACLDTHRYDGNVAEATARMKATTPELPLTLLLDGRPIVLKAVPPTPEDLDRALTAALAAEVAVPSSAPTPSSSPSR